MSNTDLKITSTRDNSPYHERGELNTHWSLWWRFKSGGRNKSYDSSNLEPVFTFSNLNEFSQIYNGSILGKYSTFIDKKLQNRNSSNIEDKEFQNLPIDCLMLFRNGVRPEWEDKLNTKGGHFVVEINSSDYDLCDQLWKELSCYLVGETWQNSEYVTGLRILHKTKGDKISIKYEIWLEITKNERLSEKFDQIENQERIWNSLLSEFYQVVSESFGEIEKESIKWEIHSKVPGSQPSGVNKNWKHKA